MWSSVLSKDRYIKAHSVSKAHITLWLISQRRCGCEAWRERPAECVGQPWGEAGAAFDGWGGMQRAELGRLGGSHFTTRLPQGKYDEYSSSSQQGLLHPSLNLSLVAKPWVPCPPNPVGHPQTLGKTTTLTAWEMQQRNVLILRLNNSVWIVGTSGICSNLQSASTGVNRKVRKRFLNSIFHPVYLH